jgi:hypothetical protein
VEKTNFNGKELPELGAEMFAVNDSSVGKTFTIRDATDEQLVRYRKEFQKNHALAQQKFMAALGELQDANTGVNIIIYEIDRRARMLAIASNLPPSGHLAR